MKARFVVLLVIMAALASQNALAQTVKYSVVVTGPLAICFNAAITEEIACTNPAAVPVPVTYLVVGYGTKNPEGGCESRVVNYAASPPIGLPPVVQNQTVVKQITDYDPSTGAGDYSITNYTGGQCVGVNFNSSGATVTSTSTAHFQDSENGNRRDYMDTAVTGYPINSQGTFSLHGVERALVPTR
jgi:hypothetical protein